MTRTDSKRQETSKSGNQISDVSRMQHILYVRYACVRESKNAQRKTFLMDHKLKDAETNLIFNIKIDSKNFAIDGRIEKERFVYMHPICVVYSHYKNLS